MSNNFFVKKIFFSNTAIILLYCVFVLKFIYENSNYDYDIWFKINSVLGWIFLLYSVLSWQRLREEIICFYIAYLILFYLFTYGQTLLYIFNIAFDQNDLLFIYNLNTDELINAQFFSLLCLMTFHLGALLICKEPSNVNLVQYDFNVINDDIIKAIKYTGFILVVISLPGFLQTTISATLTALHGGYGAIYNYQSGGLQNSGLIVRLFKESSNYFIPGLICLLVAYKTNNKIKFIIFIMLIFSIINTLYVGGRGGAAVLILTIILIYFYNVKFINKWKMLLIILFSYFFVSFLSVVASLRGFEGRSFTEYFTAYIKLFGNENLFLYTIIEIGGTMFPLCAVMRIVPDTCSYLFGSSYIYAITSIIPNLGFWDVHPAQLYSAGPEWLMQILNLSYGPGFTLIADSYRNFGWYGFIVFIVFGLLFGKIYSLVDRHTIYIKPEIYSLVVIFFLKTAISVRGDNLNILRPLFYVVLPIAIMIKYIYYKNIYNRKC